ncbi:hypothetical protein ACFUTY_25450 [Streptomyces sp. NPDC057362]|uniref:hypothetical protein n=1 Tax=Streptomyces sp. NPDC057362 TaxID=3346106 RepID=UPI00362C7748
MSAARARADRVFCTRTVARLGEVCARRLLDLMAEGNEDGTALLASLKRDPGAVGLDSLLTEIAKLAAVRQLELRRGMLTGCSENGGRVVGSGDQDVPLDLRDAGEDVRTTLLAALCASWQAEITDALVHKINARAERR